SNSSIAPAGAAPAMQQPAASSLTVVDSAMEEDVFPARVLEGLRLSDIAMHALESAYTMVVKSEPCIFGLVAGLGVGGGFFYYRSLVHAHLARGLVPGILMVHADVRRVLDHAAARETRELATYLSGFLHQLARGGAQMAAIPAFAPQICAQELATM